MKKQLRIALIVSGAQTAATCAVMNFMLIPQIEAAAGGLRCFDMRFGYGFEAAKAFLSALTAQGKDLYLRRQLPLDFVYPLAYGAFFMLAFYALQKRRTPLLAVPALLAAADYAENICVVLMLRAGDPAKALVAAGSAATVTKTLLMYLCFAVLLALPARAAVAKRKRRAAEAGKPTRA